MFSDIVVAYDGSDHADARCDLAKHYGARLHLSHMPPVDTYARSRGGRICRRAGHAAIG